MSSFNESNMNDDESDKMSTNNATFESQMKNVPFEDQLLYKTWLLMAAQQHSPGRSPKVPRIDGRLTWPDDLELDLQQEISNSIYNGDSLFNFSGLTVFKREFTQPTPENYSPNCVNDDPQQQQLINNSRNDGCSGNRQQQQAMQSGFMGTGSTAGGSAGSSDMNPGQNFNSPNQYENNGSPPQPPPPPMEIGNANSRESYGQFEYMLKAATAIGQKHNEDSLTYLNQGQSYEIKFKKTGDLGALRGKLLKSVIKICFYERRLQYMEKEQMRQWQETHPNDRVLELDVPLSYGIVHFNQPANFSFSNMIEVLWDPQQDCGVYIRVNCISTEFTPKKHGGEKGVPFRIQVETYEDNVYGANKPLKPLHAAACQIKVFKLKGADRKHKQDREKIMKRPPSEQEKYQRSYEYTILHEISLEHLYSMIPNCYSPESIKRNISPASDSPNQYLSKYDALVPFGAGVQTGGLMRTDSMTSTNGLLKPDESEIINLNKMDYEEYITPISAEFSPVQVAHWLAQQRLSKFTNAFSRFSGVDLLRMTKEDLIQICGLADGIRMYNIIHSKSISPRLTIYVTLDNAVYHAIYLHSYSIKELFQKLHKVPGFVEPPSSPWDLQTKYSDSNNSLVDAVKMNLFMIGPANVQVMLTDEVLSNVKNDSLFAVESQNGKILMRPEVVMSH
ncbi:transcription factor CP2 isoform X2 [Culicoides brevitarsis]|uniref:transcription factor CP2 isoform X2 n=1 Tax=Culicoides brevitarsis TaxID=469753 RepID=UPI00307C3190